MKTINNTPGSRFWTVAELPQKDPSCFGELDIEVKYRGDSNVASAIPLDEFIAPLFRLAPRLLAIAAARSENALAAMGLSPAEIAEVQRLAGYKKDHEPVCVSRDMFDAVVNALDLPHRGVRPVGVCLCAEDMDYIMWNPNRSGLADLFVKRYLYRTLNGASLTVTLEEEGQDV